MISPLRLITLAALAVAVVAAPALASITPVPGVDVVVHSHPHGLAMTVGGSDARGAIHAVVKAPGGYTVSIVCHKSPCAHFTTTLTASNGMLKPLPGGTYDLTVVKGPVTLAGMVKLAK